MHVCREYAAPRVCFESVYVDLQYDFSHFHHWVCACVVFVVLGLSVRLSSYSMLWVRLLR